MGFGGLGLEFGSILDDDRVRVMTYFNRLNKLYPFTVNKAILHIIKALEPAFCGLISVA